MSDDDAKALLRDALALFTGLEGDARCLEFDNFDRPVKTASVAQAGKLIYNTAVDRWCKHGAELQPSLAALVLQPG